MNTTTTTIANQLGGRKFQVMTGATFIQDTNPNTLNVQFKMCRKANIMQVTYNEGTDLYDVTFLNWRGFKITTVRVLSDVFADQLIEIFESTTGLYARL